MQRQIQLTALYPIHLISFTHQRSLRRSTNTTLRSVGVILEPGSVCRAVCGPVANFPHSPVFRERGHGGSRIHRPLCNRRPCLFLAPVVPVVARTAARTDVFACSGVLWTCHAPSDAVSIPLLPVQSCSYACSTRIPRLRVGVLEAAASLFHLFWKWTAAHMVADARRGLS
jgi:hypothetical protein